jgi:16S rRNA (cytosine967-C5)-methyltransferase
VANPPKSPKVPGARDLALDILAAARRRERSVEDLLAAALGRHRGLPRSERALLLELVQGVKRWEIKVDYFLAQVSDLPLRKLHPLVHQILRLGAYQILMLDKVPARAAVHEAGRQARGRGLPAAHAGFINAVLRRLAAGELPPIPPLKADPVQSLSLEHSHPAWLVRRWLERRGLEQTRALLAANNRIPPLTIRVNPLKTDAATLKARLAREGVEAAACRFSPEGLNLLALTSPPLELPSYREGLWLFQDEGAQLASRLLPLTPGARLLEIGAGRGGKTSHLAAALGDRGLILALDRHFRRLKELKLNLARLGVTAAHPLVADATAALPCKSGAADAVLVDAPCSSLGIIRRHPEIKGRLREAALAAFPPRQLAMLAAAAPCLRPGGRLLYITCTSEPAENEEVIRAFLTAHPEFHLATDLSGLPAPARSLIEPPGFFRTSPAEHDLDAFFAAVLAKEG